MTRSNIKHEITVSLILASLVAACGGDETPSSTAASGEWSVKTLDSPAGPSSAQANFAATADGSPVMSWLQPVGESQVLEYAVFAAGAWSEPREIARGDNWFINWADFPSVVPIDSDTWIAHWLVLEPEQAYAYDVAYAMSSDGGRSWSDPRILNEDETNAQHGFVTFFPWDAGIGAIWLDDRVVGAMTIDELLETKDVVGMTLRYARLTTTGEVTERGLIDELVCDCCQTDAAVVPDGPLIVYRDRSAEELRDIVVRRHDGRAWSPPVAPGSDNWIIDGCPVNGPAVDADGRDVAVAWFTAPDNQARVRFAWSHDGGQHFEAALTLDETGSFGHVDVEIVDADAAIVSWWRRADAGGMDLVARKIFKSSGLGDIRVIAHSDSVAPIDVPQMGHVDGDLVFAWTEFEEPAGIKSVTAPVW